MSDYEKHYATHGSVSRTERLSLDLLTLIAIAIVAYILQNVLHEGMGHGGACVLVGGQPVALSTAYFDCDRQDVSEIGRRFISAAGTLVNLAAGLLFWRLLRQTRSSMSPTLRSFLWLSMSVNLLTATGYPLFSGILGVGDWIAVVDGLQPVWAWRLGLIIVGLVLYALCIWLALREMSVLIGEDEPQRFVWASRLSIVPYIAGSVASTFGSLFNPLGGLLILTSAASSFGGTSALAWMTQLFKTDWFPKSSEPRLLISRNWGWVFTAGALLILHIIILGPSLEF